MITKLITSQRRPATEIDGTGTFADGVFVLNSARQLAFDRDNGMRASYTRDYLLARQLDEAPAAHA